MLLCLTAVLAAALTGFLTYTLDWSLLMILAGFAVSFCYIGLLVFSGKGGRLLCSLSVAAPVIAYGASVFHLIPGGTQGIWSFLLICLVANVALILLAFLFLVIVCARVDMNEPQAEHDDPFYRKVMNLYIEALMHLALVKFTVKGLEKTPKEGRFLLVCNHLENPDPALLLHAFKDSQLAFISKKENTTMPIVNKFMHKILCQYIDREDDRQGLRVILKCIQLLKNDEVSIGVFPEGWTSDDGRIRHFRPGVFKIAQKANVPIVVCTLQNTQHIIPNMKKLKSTPVELHLVDVIPAEELKGVTTTQIADRVYEMMIADLGEDFRAIDTETP